MAQAESLADIAARVAERWPVFPVRIDENGEKRPLVKWRDGAVRGAAAARALFEQWAGVANAIGVPTGWASGLLVIDVDVKAGAPGRAWYEANRERLGETRGHGTRSGGGQLLYRVPEAEIRNSASKLAAGVDVRGEGGYVVWPGSPGYVVKIDAEVAPLPGWLLDSLVALRPRPVDLGVLAGTSAADVLAAAGLMGDGTAYGLAALKRAVAAIVGAEDGTKHDTLNREAYGVGGLVSGGEVKDEVAWAALEAALAEIAGACRDPRAAQETLRDGYAEGKAKPRPEGVRRLQQAVGDFAGVEAPVLAQAKALMGDELTPAEGETLQDAVFRGHVWVESVERFGCLGDGRLLSLRNFSVRHNWMGPPMSSTKSAAAQYLADERRRVVDSLTYLPGGDRIVAEDGIGWCLNTWRPSDLNPAAGDIGPWRRRFEEMVPDPELRWHLEAWMAHVVQRPGVKINWAPVLLSVPGMGKDWLMRPVVLGLGEHNTRTIGVMEAESDFNDWCAAAALVIFNEAHSTGRVALSERMKPHNAAPPTRISINRKNVPGWEQPNRHKMLYYSNRMDAVFIERGDRRFFVLRIEAEKLPKEAWVGLWDWMAAGGAAAVLAHLLAFDLSRFNAGGEAPWTAAKAEMQRDTMSDAAALVADAIEAEEWPDLVNPNDLALRIHRQGGSVGRIMPAQRLSVLLKQSGAQPVNGGRMVRLPAPATTGATVTRLMSLRNHEIYAVMPPAALAREFLKKWAEKDGKEFLDPQPALTDVTLGSVT
jgi:hypothetical protein